MAQRIGKYKITKRESEISLRDGGTIAGNIRIDGTIIAPAALSASTDPGVAGQLFVTTSRDLGGVGGNTNVATGSAKFVLVSTG